MDSPFYWVATKFWGLLLFFVCALVVFLIILYLLKGNKIALKLADYLWICLALGGLISLTGEARRLISRNKIGWQIVSTQSWFDDIVRDVKTNLALPWQSIVGSDEIQYSKAHEWYNAIKSKLPERPDAQAIYNAINSKLPELPGKESSRAEPSFPQLSPPPPLQEITEGALNAQVKNTNDVFAGYEASRQKVEELSKQTEKLRHEDIYIALAPILVSAGLAIRATKTTGEVFPGFFERKKKIKLPPNSQSDRHKI